MDWCGRRRWPACPVPGPLVLELELGFGLLVTFKRTKLFRALFSDSGTVYQLYVYFLFNLREPLNVELEAVTVHIVNL